MREQKMQRGLAQRDAALRLKRARQVWTSCLTESTVFADGRKRSSGKTVQGIDDMSRMGSRRLRMVCPAVPLRGGHVKIASRRPTFLPSMKTGHSIASTSGDATYRPLLAHFLKESAELTAPRDILEATRDCRRLAFYENEIRHAVHQRSGRSENLAFQDITRCSLSGGHVVVIGLWSCLLGWMAATYGASKVTCIEQNPTVYKISVSVLETNKLCRPVCILSHVRGQMPQFRRFLRCVRRPS